MSDTAALVKIEGLHKSYGGVIQVLQGLDIEMKAGDRVVVIGPSGGWQVDSSSGVNGARANR